MFIRMRLFASGQQGSIGLTTNAVTARPRSAIPYHTHPTGESITVVKGEADTLIEGRRYRLRPFDSIHVPAGVAHSVRNASSERDALMHTAFPTESVEREFVDDNFTDVERQSTNDDCPETLVRFEEAEAYEVGDGIEARDLFAKRLGAKGICGGYGKFPPGTGLPCHTHVYDESITIVDGVAVCQVAGAEYEVGNMDTVCVPTGRPHRFFNNTDKPMTMIWVYAGDEPDRELVLRGLCDGTCGFEPQD